METSPRKWRDQHFSEPNKVNWKAQWYPPDVGAEICYTWPHANVLFYQPERDAIPGFSIRSQIKKIHEMYKAVLDIDDFVIGVDRRKACGITIGFANELVAVQARLVVNHLNATKVIYSLTPETRPMEQHLYPKPQPKEIEHGRKSVRKRYGSTSSY